MFAPSSAHPPADRGTVGGSQENAFQAGLARVPGMSIAIMSAAQGVYSRAQLLLDITQGARVASSAYAQPRPPALSLRPTAPGALVEGFATARRRAEDAPQLLRPGLLASQVPDGCGYAGSGTTDALDSLVCADRTGRIAAVSLGAPATLLARIAVLRTRSRLVVADLPGGGEGYADLLALGVRRPAGELLLVVQRASARRGHELLWAGADGLTGGAGRMLTSQTTTQRGLIAAVDIAPTALRQLGVAPIPAAMRGQPIRAVGVLRAAQLRSLMARLHVIGERRTSVLLWLLGTWAVLVLACARWARARSLAIRAGAIGVLWAPVVALLPAAFAASATVELLVIVLGCLALGALTDRAMPWPRAPLAPAVAAVVLLASDALAGTQLLLRSVFGPDPALGARFYGIGNELKSGLAVLGLAAIAALLYPAPRPSAGRRQAGLRRAELRWRRRAVATMAGAGVVLALVEGSARIGAGVGGVILVSAGFAVASVMLLPGGLTRRRALLVLVAPPLALCALAVLDLATAHGTGHYIGSILHARSPADLRDVITRRYSAAWRELRNHAMPYLTALALLCSLLALRHRRRLLSPVAEDPVWEAALAGGLTAGVVGALVEDSGPLLFVVAVLALGCVLAYLWGRPVPAAHAAGHARSQPAQPRQAPCGTPAALPRARGALYTSLSNAGSAGFPA